MLDRSQANKPCAAKTQLTPRYRSAFHPTALPVVVTWAAMTLAACQSGNGNSEDPEPDLPEPDITGSILSSYYVENFDAFRDAALDLIQNDPRYLLQTADGSWWYDRNGNDVYDDGLDVTLLSDPFRHAGVHYAHASGLTGDGQIIAFSDGGYLPSHEVFDGKTMTSFSNVVDGHGTAVASIAVGDSSSMIGIAPGADVIFGDFYTFAQLTETVQAAEQQGAVALNNSWGFPSIEPTRQAFETFDAAQNSGPYLDALRNYTTEGVVVFAASNDYYASKAGFLDVLPAFEPSLEPGWLSVISGVPVMIDDDIISAERVSTACLEAARWCLAADGTWTSAWSGSNADYQFGTGTSFATPVVSGALALLAEAFPNLEPHDLRIRLLASADNDFEGFVATDTVELVDGFSRGISNEWGHGFLDVKAALMPIGPTSLPLADGSTMEMREATLVGGGAYGDALTKALAGTQIAAHDALAAEFTIDASDLVALRRPVPLTPLSIQHDSLSQRSPCCGQTRFLKDTTPVSLGFGELQLDVALPQNPEISDSFGAALKAQRRTDWGQFDLGLGVGRDDHRYGFSTNAISTNVITAEFAVRSDLSDATSLGLSFGVAQVLQGPDQNLTEGVRLDHANATLTQKNVFQNGDRLTLSAGMPVAVVSGHTNLTLPVARATLGYDFNNLEVDLTPQNREIRLGARYDVELTPTASATFSLHHAINRGNVGGETASGVFLGVRTAF